MIEFFRKNLEPNKKIRTVETVILVLLLLGSLFSLATGLSKINEKITDYQFVGTLEMVRDESYEDYDQDSTYCDVVYVNGEDKTLMPWGPRPMALMPSSRSFSISAALWLGLWEPRGRMRAFLDSRAAVSTLVATPTPTSSGGHALRP